MSESLKVLNEILEYSYGMLTAEKYGLQHKILSMIKEQGMMCKDCEHFHIDSEPMMPFEMGRASCDKYDLIADYVDKRKLNRLTCVKEQEHGTKNC